MPEPLRKHISTNAENLAKAIDLLKRGKKTMQRVGWEPGETDEQWSSAVTHFFTELQQDSEMAKMLGAYEPEPEEGTDAR